MLIQFYYCGLACILISFVDLCYRHFPPKEARKLILFIRDIESPVSRAFSEDKLSSIASFYKKLTEHHTENVFAQEFCDEFLIISDVLDVGVQISVHQVEILKRQEDLHARMHCQAIRQTGNILNRYRKLKVLLKSLVMNTPAIFRDNLLGNIETSFGSAMWAAEFPLGKFYTNILQIHWLEEAEHGVLTSSCLKQKCNLTSRLLFYPIGVLALLLLWTLPIVMSLGRNPRILTSWIGWLHLLQYIIAVGCAMTSHVAEGIIFWILPFRKPHFYYKLVREAFLLETRRRNIEFDILDQMEYFY